MGKTRAKTGEKILSAAQKATIEKLKILIRELVFAKFPSFLYIQREILGKIDRDLSRMDDEYVNRHKIPISVVKEMAKENL